MAVVYFCKTQNGSSIEEKKKTSETAREIVKKLAAKSLSLKEESLTFETVKNGKPYLKGAENFHFNISHSENAIAIAVDNCEIGVDIEKLRPADFRICERFFSQKEKEYVGKSDRRFFEIWTKKEAYIKKHSLALKNLKTAKTENIFTKEVEGFIISVCCEINRVTDIIVLENSEDL